MKLSDFVSKIINGFLDAVFPPRCIFCDRVTALENGICSECSEKARKIEEPVCLKCGMSKKNCECKSRSRFFDGLCAPYEYEGVVKKGIHIFKFDGQRDNSRYYSHIMAQCVKNRFGDIYFDIVTSVPATVSSVKKRGFDQSSLLARGVAKELGLVYDCNVIKKIYETKSQHFLSILLRRGNLTGAFEVADKSKAEGKTVLLCDDVSTTGETLDECSKMLYLAGAEKIYCSVIALTQIKDK
ncbi:MAG: ComF family protein [Clostridia bacterium]|nr:ComF family protein [Clostridia bacterium]